MDQDGNPIPNGDVTIGANGCGPNVVVDQSFTGANGLGKITINSAGKLVFPKVGEGGLPQELGIDTTGIAINDGGLFSVGTQQCPIGANQSGGHVTITFTGNKVTCNPSPCNDGSIKGIEVRKGGILRLFGEKGVAHPTSSADPGVSWTYLSSPAGPASYAVTGSAAVPVAAADQDVVLHLADDVTKNNGAWQLNDWIVIGTTSFSPFESEFAQIAGLSPEAGGSRVTLMKPLQHYHFGSAAPTRIQFCGNSQTGKFIACGSNPTCKVCDGSDPNCTPCISRPDPLNFSDGASKNFGVDERGEVGLISRSIKLTATTPAPPPLSQDPRNPDPTLHWGGEIRILSGAAEVDIEGVELEKFGKDQRASYPIHFHMAGDMGNKPVVDANSIHHSFNKCITAHMTSNLTFEDNVCARVVGHIFYEEWGNEDGINFLNNLGLGASSNNFGMDPNIQTVKVEGDGAVVPKDYWQGDYLGRSIGYDALGVPNTDNQQNPTKGACKKHNPGDPNGDLVPAVQKGDGTPAGYDTQFPFEGIRSGKECDTSKGELYTEPASGFWITNPGTQLVGNSIGGCQGVGRAYWYVPPGSPNLPDQLTNLQYKKVGTFVNNRAHACFAGLYDEGENDIRSQQLFPRALEKNASKNVIATFDGFTATRIRDRGLWIRPLWYAVTNGRFATTRDSVSLVTSGGLDGNAPGVWSLLKDSVIVAESQNNVDRWGPCPTNSGTNFGCVDGFVNGVGGNKRAQDVNSRGYITPFWNPLGFLIYDGPVRIEHDRFVNFKQDISGFLTTACSPPATCTSDQTFLTNFTAYPNGAKKYEGDAALGWFNSNQSAYPTSTVGQKFVFENTDLRHQIFTERVFLAAFNDGDKNTAILDEDGSLSGFKMLANSGQPLPDGTREFPISLNNLEFNRASDSVNECQSQGQQDSDAEGRPTSLMSPANLTSLEVEWGTTDLINADPNTKLQLRPPLLREDVTFTKDSLDYMAHQAMTLVTGRDGRGTWEPKVASGFGYTITARNPQAGTGMPPQRSGVPNILSIGLTDPVKTNISGSNPFFARIGICYTGNKNGAVYHPPDASLFSIKRGYKSWGGNGVNFSDQDLEKYFVILDRDHSFNGEHCQDLDQAHTDNLTDDQKGCPAHGVVAAPKPDAPDGGCVAPATKQTVGSSGNMFVACVYPTSQLSSVTSTGGLKTGGNPDPTKYYYDSSTGWLFFYVLQEYPNPIAGSPLGSCSATGGGANDDPSCPDVTHRESFYACPAQGCVDYVVRLNDPNYVLDTSNCGSPYPTYAQNPPAGQNLLGYSDNKSTQPVTPVEMTSPQNFKHTEPATAPTCNNTTSGP